MNIKTLAYTFLFCFALSGLRGQSISSEITDKYPASITTKLYNVLSMIELDKNKQKALAQIFWKEDSTIAVAIKNDQRKQFIDSIHAKAHQLFHKALDKDEQKRYYFSLLKDGVSDQAKAKARITSELIGGDDAATKKLEEIYFAEYLEIESIKSQLKYSPSSFHALKNATSYYESLSDEILNSLKQEKYFADRIQQLDSIKPLKDDVKKKMKTRFNLLCKTAKNYKSYADSFNQVLHLYIKDADYYAVLYKKEIAGRALNNSKLTTNSLGKTYKLSQRCFKTLDSILYAREKKLAALYYTFQIISPAKDSLENCTISYYDSLVNHLLYREGVNTPSSLFFTVLKYRDMLKLSNAKVDSLVDMGFKFEALCRLKKKQNDISFFRPAAEREEVKTIITEDKLYELTRFFNKDNARKNAFSDWREMKRFGLAEPEDSVKAIAQLFQYNLSKLTIIDYYKYDKQGYWKAFGALDDSRPTRIRQLHGAWKMEEAEKRKKQQKEQKEADDKNTPAEANTKAIPEQEPAKKNYRGTYQW